MTQSRTSEVYERLRLDIVRARHKPGERLRIDALCKAMDASLGAVREALSRLSSEGLVIAQPQRGFAVAPISLQDLEDLTSVRCHIEELCLERAIVAGDLGWESDILAAYHRLSKTPVFIDEHSQEINEDWPRRHGEFHDTLVAACDSEWWLKLRRQLFVQSERYRRLTGFYSDTERDVDCEHREIMEATLAGNIKLAKECLTAHLRKTADTLIKSNRLPNAKSKQQLR